jgi:hypothetical protein
MTENKGLIVEARPNNARYVEGINLGEKIKCKTRIIIIQILAIKIYTSMRFVGLWDKLALKNSSKS